MFGDDGIWYNDETLFDEDGIWHNDEIYCLTNEVCYSVIILSSQPGSSTDESVYHVCTVGGATAAARPALHGRRCTTGAVHECCSHAVLSHSFVFYRVALHFTLLMSIFISHVEFERRISMRLCRARQLDSSVMRLIG